MNNFLLAFSVCVLSFVGHSQTVYPTNVINTDENPVINANIWTLIFENSEVSIEYSTVNCDPSMGFDFEQVNLKFTNKTAQKIDLDWHIHLYYDGECATCDFPEEYSRTLRLGAGEAREGNCDRETINELKLFSKFTDANYTLGAKLTAFQLAELTVTILENE